VALPASSRSEEDPVQAGGGDERRRREGDRARAREREREKEEGTGTVQPQSDVGGDGCVPPCRPARLPPTGIHSRFKFKVDKFTFGMEVDESLKLTSPRTRGT